MGWTGLKLNTQPMNIHVNYYDVGYRLIQNFWSRGIAQESAKASLEYGFRELKLKEIYAATHVDNIASDKILTNVGLLLTGRFDYEGMPCNWYQANFEDWNNQNRTIICKN